MDVREHFQQALESLGDHPRRVLASAMGVFWGAAAIVVILAWGSGFREFMRQEMSRYGKGCLFVIPAVTSSGFPGHRAGVHISDLFYLGFMVFMGVAGTVTLLIGAVGIANYQLATLAERAVEIAVARAIGARARTVVIQTVLESLLVSGGTALLGVLLGLAGCIALGTLMPPGLFPTPIISPVAVGVTAMATLGVAVIAALVPALRVRQMEIAIALRAGV